MKLSAALEYEKLREAVSSWNKVILHRDGKFYHAYDWSAWLIKQYVCTEEFQQQRGDEKLLQVNRFRCELFMKTRFLRYGTFDRDMTTFTLSKPMTAMCA